MKISLARVSLALIALTSLASAQTPDRPALRAAGQDSTYTPLIPGFRARLTGRVDSVSSIITDADGADFTPGPAFDTQLRVNATYDTQRNISWVRLLLEYEHDFVVGRVWGGEADLDGVFVPGQERFDAQQIRNLRLQASFDRYLTVGAGFMTSHWGLGLLANDGAHGWAPGSARFSDPRGGDVVLRGFLATGPHTDQNLMVFLAADMVWDDDIMISGDDAIQFVGGVKLGTMKPYTVGLYGVYRIQDAPDGQRTLVAAIDLFAGYTVGLGHGHSLTYEAEGALILGTTELAPSTDFPEHDVLQLGGALRVTYDAPLGGAVLDVLYASGDRNLDDKSQNAFGVDPNYDMGMLLYRQVLPAMTARSAVNAADPDLVGVPNEDLDRFPSRERPTNTIAINPRGFIRPTDGLEIFAGVLIAMAEVDFVDPLNTRVSGGGDARNPLGDDPGRYYGTEFDLGIRLQTLLWGTQLTIGAEGAVFLPGDALTGAGGLGNDPIYGGRLSLTWEL